MKKRSSAWVLGLGLAAVGMAVPFACVAPQTQSPGFDAGSYDGASPTADAGGPSLGALPTSIDFGPSPCGGASPADKTITIGNTGAATLRISAALKNATAFSLSSTSATIAPGQTGSFALHALPVPASATAGAAISDTLFVTTNVPGFASSQVPVTITPQGATITLTPASAAFGSVPIGTAATPIAIAVGNTGNAAAQVAFGTPTATQFTVATPSTVSVSPDAGTGQVSIQFTATSVQPATGTVPITVTGAAQCGAAVTSLPVSSQLAVAVAQVPTALVDFQLAPCGGAAPATKSLVVTNAGAAALHVTAATFGTASFSVTSPASFPLTIGPNAMGTLTLAAAGVPGAATAGAAITDTLTLTTDDLLHPTFHVPVSVTPQGVTFSLTPAASFPGTMAGAAAAAIPLTLTNIGNMGVILSPGAPTNGAFTLGYTGQPDSVALAANVSVPGLTAGFTAPNTLGTVTATSALGVNEPMCGNGPTSIAFSGASVGEDGGPFQCDGGLCGDGCVPTVCSLIGPNACGEVQTCGEVLECGSCQAGNVCNPVTHSCQSTSATCVSLGATCGYVLDECGVQQYCGACAADEVCQGATHTCSTCTPLTVANCGATLCGTFPSGCVPSAVTITCSGCDGTCSPNNQCNCLSLKACPLGACGVISDGCGGTLSCPACSAPECQGHCGTIQNACGSGTANCGPCPNGSACTGANNTCVSCTPKTCGPLDCGSGISDGCGGFIDCSSNTCGADGGPGQTTCVNNQCTACVPSTCGPNDCGPGLPDGCGGTKDCSANTCGADGGAGSTTCLGGSCCTPKTCGVNDCGPGVSDNCGGTIDCSANTCGGALCFNNACCTPTTCASGACGDINPGCGQDSITCPGCAGNQVCNGISGCCTPQAACNANNCGPSVYDGCSSFLDCSANTCTAGQECGEFNNGVCCTPTIPCGTDCSASHYDGCMYIDCSANNCNSGAAGSCINGSCCAPLTCASVATPSCQPIPDNCGGTLVCYACPAGSICESDGSCCTPAVCGAQQGLVSDGCGGTMYCSGG